MEGRASSAKQPAVPSSGCTTDRPRIHASDRHAGFQELINARKPAPAETNDAGVGVYLAGERSDTTPWRQYPRRTESNSEAGREGSQKPGKVAAIVEGIVAPAAQHFELYHRLIGWPEVDPRARLADVLDTAGPKCKTGGRDDQFPTAGLRGKS